MDPFPYCVIPIFTLNCFKELFANIEQFTKQAKKAAETLESAVEASKSKVKLKGKSVGKDTLEDMDFVRKNVVDDFKTAFKSLGDSNENESVDQSDDSNSKSAPCSDSSSVVVEKNLNNTKTDEDNKSAPSPVQDKVDSSYSMKSSEVVRSCAPVSVRQRSSASVSSLSSGPPSSSYSYDMFGNIDMYSLATQTHDFFEGLLGRVEFYCQPTYDRPFSLDIYFRLYILYPPLSFISLILFFYSILTA